MASDTLFFDGKKYISTRRASEQTGYSADYIGQIARTGKVASRMVGHTRFVEEKGLHRYHKDPGAPAPAPEPKATRYLSTKEAAKLSGYTSDYIGQLARAGKIESKLIGRVRVIDEESLVCFADEDVGASRDTALIAASTRSISAPTAQLTRAATEAKDTVTAAPSSAPSSAARIQPFRHLKEAHVRTQHAISKRVFAYAIVLLALSGTIAYGGRHMPGFFSETPAHVVWMRSSAKEAAAVGRHLAAVNAIAGLSDGITATTDRVVAFFRNAWGSWFGDDDAFVVVPTTASTSTLISSIVETITAPASTSVALPSRQVTVASKPLSTVHIPAFPPAPQEKGLTLYELALGMVLLREEFDPRIDLAIRLPHSNQQGSGGSDIGQDDLDNYLLLTGGSLTGNLGGTNATFTGSVTASTLSVTASTTLNSVEYGWPSDNGDSGEVLTTNGAGVLTWEAASTADDVFELFNGSGIRATTTNKSLLLGSVSATSSAAMLEIHGTSYFNGNVGIGTTSPYQEFSVAGDFALTGGIYDNNATRGTNGMVLQTTGTGVTWVATSTLGFAASTDLANYLTLSAWYATTTDALDEGLSNLYYTDARVSSYVTSSSTIPKGAPINGNVLLGNGSIWTSVATSSLGTFSQWTTSGSNIYYSTGNVGIGTTSPYAKLSVVGQTVSEYFTATSTSATSTLPNAAITNLALGSDYVNDLTGNGLSVSGGVLNVSTTSLSTGFFLQNGNSFGTLATLGTNDSNALAFETAGTEWMRITSGGNVGIGTTSPYAKLSVVGQVVGEYFTATSTSATSTFAGAHRLSAAAGTHNAAAPTLSFGDGDTGVYEAADDQLTFSTNGSVRFDILSTGVARFASDVQLTTTGSYLGVPNGTRWVYGGGNGLAGYGDGGEIVNFNNGASYVRSRFGIGTTSPYALLSVHATSTSQDTTLFAIASSTASATTTHFVVLNDGKVGVGTADPFGQLAIEKTGGDLLALRYSSAQKRMVVGIGANSASGFFGSNLVYSGSTNVWNYDKTGTMWYIGDPAGSNTLSIGVASGTAGNSAGIGEGAVERLSITNTGNVGIGTTSPSKPLSVQGDALISGTLTAGGIVSTSTSITFSGLGRNMVVTTDGNGTLLASSTPQVAAVNATSTSATSTLAGGLTVDGSTFVIDHANSRVGVGTATPFYDVDIWASAPVVNLSPTTQTNYALYRQSNSGNISAFGIENSAGGGIFTGTLPYATVLGNSSLGSAALQLVTDGVVRMTVANDGNVGIGTTSPYAKLSVVGQTVSEYFTATSTAATSTFSGDVALGQRLWAAGTSGTNGMLLQTTGTGVTWVATSTLGFAAATQIGSGTAGQFPYYASTGSTLTATSAIFLATDGKIGIGSTTPQATLAVKGAAGTANIVEIASSTDANIVTVTGTGLFGIGGAPTEKLTVTSGNIAVSPAQWMGISAGQSLTYNDGSDVGIWNSIDSALINLDSNNNGTTAAFNIGRNGTNNATSKLFTVLEGGNVGIASTSPTGLLSINPDAITGPAFVIGSSTATQFIVTNAGSVGVGSASPASKLAVSGNFSVGANYTGTAAPSNGAIIEGNLGIGTTTPAFSLHVVNAASGDTRIRIGNGAAASTANRSRVDLSLLTSASERTAAIVEASFTDTTDASRTGRLDFLVANSGSFDATPEMVITGAGNVGIGTTTPLEKLNVLGGVMAAADVYTTSGSALLHSTASLGPYIVGNTDSSGNATVNAAAMRSLIGGNGFIVASSPATTVGSARTFTNRFTIETDGDIVADTSTFILDATNNRIGIGTTTPRTQLHVEGAGQATFGWSDSGNTGGSLFLKDTGTAAGNGGAVLFGGTNKITPFAGIKGYLTDGSNNTLGALSFSLRTNSTDSSMTEQMVIDRLGNIGVGTTSPMLLSGLIPKMTTSGSLFGLHVRNTGDARVAVNDGTAAWSFATGINTDGDAAIVKETVGTWMSFTSAGNVGVATTSPWRTLSVVGTMAVNGLTSSATGNYVCINTTTFEVTRGNGSACTTSSARFKENVNDLAYGLDAVLKMRAVDFNYKVEMNMGDATHIGFIAEEMEEIVPEVVTKDEKGKPSGIDYPSLTAVLAKAIQELKARFDSLEARVVAIESRLATAGASIQGSIARFAEVITDRFILGSPESPTGITLFDEVTGEPYCLSVRNGETMSRSGECGRTSPQPDTTGGTTPEPTPQPAPEPPPDPAPAPTEPTTQPSPTDTQPAPDPAVEPTSDPSPEPTEPTTGIPPADASSATGTAPAADGPAIS